ncbi:MAG: hypothetical protein ACO1Q7_03725 [Gemmatimonas sp.]
MAHEPETSAGAPGGDHSGDGRQGETVGEVSLLYLGNILYAIERCALSLESEDKPVDAAFYRGIGRKLAEAYGRGTRPL